MLSLHYRNSLSDAVGVDHGLMEPELFGLQTRLTEAHQSILRMGTAGKLGFLDLPNQKEEARQIAASAKKWRRQFDTFVVLGIGGSALGAAAVQQALHSPYWNLLGPKERKGSLKLFIFDNVDPRWAADLLQILPLKTTLFNVISKSGTTAESLAAYFVFRKAVEKAVGPKKAAQHFLITTDAQRGYLRELASREKISALEVPGNVGGRFSVLSAVGLAPAAATGVDIDALLAGAREMAQRCNANNLRENPAAMYAALQFLFYQKGVKLSVMMPYSQNLWSVADWYRQLWAESLGKKLDRGGKVVHVGPTPIKALGVTDQHSQAQLYMEGPFDKLITFLSVENSGRAVPIPAIDKKHYLSGRSLNDLFKAEEQATRAALTKAQRPNLTVSVSDISAQTLGELFFFFEFAVSMMGELLNINAFDQPGVELAKIYTYALMGREGFEGPRSELEALEKKTGASRAS